MKATTRPKFVCINCGEELDHDNGGFFCSEKCRKQTEEELTEEEKREVIQETEDGIRETQNPSDTWEAKTWGI